MKYEDFKIALEASTLGDKKVPDDNKLFHLINLAILEVASIAKPLSLISNNVQDDPLLFIDDNYFIRKPIKITSTDDSLDIDDSLDMAVVYTTAMFFVKDKATAQALRNDVINNYNWNKFSVQECDFEC